MSLLHRVLLSVKPPMHEIKRFRGKINIKRPRKPHYERQLMMDVCKPIYPTRATLPAIELCRKDEKKVDEMQSILNPINPFETILAKECLNWFNHSRMVGFIHLNPARQEERDKIFAALKMEGMHLRTYGKKIVKMALINSPYEAVIQLFQSHNNIVFSETVQIEKMIKILRRLPQMVLMAGIVNGRLMSKNAMVEYSKLPSLDVCRAQLCQVLQSPGTSMCSKLHQHQMGLVANLDAYAKKLQEDGEK